MICSYHNKSVYTLQALQTAIGKKDCSLAVKKCRQEKLKRKY